MRRLCTLLVTAALAAGLSFSIGAAPAQAESLRNVYYYDWDCNRVGQLGISSGWWTSYRCVPQYNLWFLYA
ncbi:hypothetical protein Sme01_46280 [Sphaerisporangium melleum]|uniref:Secreted protein n=1 Tax=Sphaerisporangium melleum TaxID=321316 RepID=A0A917VNF0_9ACTN|nr:hypothetical protein [Sphaerisporangium melleum]GGL01694.1 hypothetical protein GCM10007964_49690 [Sphaerisporangium melleum]GII72152.1 hypothetical protein Sme01_46280 [Sphaerisporangium melleum]